jgi:hypothetical protein
MKKQSRTQRFDWSKNPTKEGVSQVYIASPGSYATYGREITKDEMAYALSTWNRINELKEKKRMFKNLFIATLVSIPFLVIIYNMLSTILRLSK